MADLIAVNEPFFKKKYYNIILSKRGLVKFINILESNYDKILLSDEKYRYKNLDEVFLYHDNKIDTLSICAFSIDKIPFSFHMSYGQITIQNLLNPDQWIDFLKENKEIINENILNDEDQIKIPMSSIINKSRNEEPFDVELAKTKFYTVIDEIQRLFKLHSSIIQKTTDRGFPFSYIFGFLLILTAYFINFSLGLYTMVTLSFILLYSLYHVGAKVQLQNKNSILSFFIKNKDNIIISFIIGLIFYLLSFFI